MYLQIKKAKLSKNQRGKNDITISMVGLYQDDGKWIKWVKMNECTLEELLKMKSDSLSFENKNGETRDLPCTQ